VVYDFIVDIETGGLNKHWISCGREDYVKQLKPGKTENKAVVDRQSSEIALETSAVNPEVRR
jgi:hypothetical protein